MLCKFQNSFRRSLAKNTSRGWGDKAIQCLSKMTRYLKSDPPWGLPSYAIWPPCRLPKYILMKLSFVTRHHRISDRRGVGNFYTYVNKHDHFGGGESSLPEHSGSSDSWEVHLCWYNLLFCSLSKPQLTLMHSAHS